MKKLLVTDPVHDLLLERFTAAGYCIDYLPEITDAEVRKIIISYTGIIINSKVKIDKEMLDKAVNLQFVARLGSGMEIVDKAYAALKNVAVYSSPEGNCNAVAEHALGMLLALYNNLLRADQQLRRFDWQREANRGYELAGKTIAIIGYGHTGSAFAQKLQGLDMNVLVYDKYLPKGYTETKLNSVTKAPFNQKTFVKESDYETIFKEADILSLHLPLSQETHYFANDALFSQFHKKITLINTSRGNVVKLTSLIKNLQSGKVVGACLDVFENETPNTFSDNEKRLYENLYLFDNVLLTPHIAGWTHEAKHRMAEVLCSKVLEPK
ncbi:MAG: hypothetical protein RI894_1548 [Bacteroidota bacterium]|jgi:D-3-phosphoglycerate dehydrogenase